jgi:hypothetical protein
VLSPEPILDEPWLIAISSGLVRYLGVKNAGRLCKDFTKLLLTITI